MECQKLKILKKIKIFNQFQIITISVELVKDFILFEILKN